MLMRLQKAFEKQLTHAPSRDDNIADRLMCYVLRLMFLSYVFLATVYSAVSCKAARKGSSCNAEIAAMACCA